MKRIGLRLALLLSLLGISLQVFAPVAAAWTIAAALDPFSNLPICSSNIGGDEQGPASSDHHVLCALCQFGCMAQVAILSDPVAAPAPVDRVAVEHFRVTASIPRGPPQSGGNARAPPTLA